MNTWSYQKIKSKKQLENMRKTVTPIAICALGRKTRRTENLRKNRDHHPDNSNVEISDNTQKRPEEI